ncbi:MAG TPA: hypothetical protein VE954_29750 [Oligoflexus sp.]|uniref:hypothetical protein n=1 Tax=Oligoflexus sp. TaxID=1971216 RepID=UPI002D57EAEA|nr:hypothetical protein [Oligoflexus sp.]HYX37309.1 hypothetical protein [Oligoflexus sp.]
MHKLLSFPDFTRNLQSPQQDRFLALQWPASPAEAKQLGHSLSPEVMHWAEDVWLIDLASCQVYWQSQAQTRRMSFHQLLLGHLDEICGVSSYRAVLGDHPWQALLLLPCLAQQNYFGLINRHSSMGDNLLQGLSWDDWWQACTRYAEHSPGEGSRVELQKRRRPMQLAMRRLGCSTPHHLKKMPPEQIRRRFGAFLGDLWSLTWQPPSPPLLPNSAAPMLFPWQSEVQGADLCVRRTLDAPARDWDVLETYLRDDLNHFPLLSSFKKGERILALEWKIVLYNLQELPVSILFRHPHSLQHDYPQQRTALLQISFALQKALQQQRLSEFEDPCFWIVSWELRITQKLQPPPRQLTLFNEGESSAWEELLNLENQLPAPLEAYALRDDWVPEDSFARAGQETIAPPQPEHVTSLNSLGRSRPLYMQKKAYPLFRPGQSLLWKFRERTMEKWWIRPGQTAVRDYYEVLCDQQLLWVARESAGHFLVLGVYG